ncbi:MAG TPA: hypothetical protein IGS37_15670 [Synechococcales cyanobacterium M55_K2018_004]|nr:hypothetical protein [Synechococcales cyanobacterium M55_K2018_004]
MRRFFGKYRGKVASNLDPLQLGRLQVSIPSVYGSDRLNWAMPCTPYAGNGVGWFAVPPLDANVWVEFEAGDPDYPIWSGCFWNLKQNPASPQALPTTKMLKTESFKITLDDIPGAGKLQVDCAAPAIAGLPQKMVFDSTGIQLKIGELTSVKMTPTEIELKIGETSRVTLRLQDIELQEGAVSVQLMLTGISLEALPASLKLATTSGTEITYPPATVKIAASGVELGAAVANLKVTPATVDISNTAASIILSPISVNVNNGALEVI